MGPETRSERLRRLGVGRPITRRDFIDGIAATAAVVASAPCSRLPSTRAASRSRPRTGPGYYPPALTGMRGSHPGSFEAAHALRDGTVPKIRRYTD